MIQMSSFEFVVGKGRFSRYSFRVHFIRQHVVLADTFDVYHGSIAAMLFALLQNHDCSSYAYTASGA